MFTIIINENNRSTNLLGNDVENVSSLSVFSNPVRHSLSGGHKLAASQSAKDLDLSSHIELVGLHVRLRYGVGQGIHVRIEVDAGIANESAVFSFNKTSFEVRKIPDGNKTYILANFSLCFLSSKM